MITFNDDNINQDEQKEIDQQINNRQNELDNINIEYLDEELENQDFRAPLDLITYDQLKSYLTNARSYFTDSLIQSVAQIVLSSHINDSNELLDIVGDIVISFSQICTSLKTVENEYGEIINRTTFNNMIIDTMKKISDKIIDNIPFSSYVAKSTFEAVTRDPEYVAELATDIELTNYCNTILKSNIELTPEYAISIRDSINSKLYMLDIVKCIQEYTSFITKDANKCGTLQELISKFKDVIDNASLNLEKFENDESNGITIDDVLDKKFYSTIIKSKEDHIKCGISIYDAITNGGFERERTYLLAGKTGGGKSTVLLNIAYGMYKAGNGMFLPELSILNKLSDNERNIEFFKSYCDANLEHLRNLDIKQYGSFKKHVLLYITLENTEEETMKRFMCRMGLLSNAFWKLIERDSYLNNLFKEKGFMFNINDLPNTMDDKLKKRLAGISSFMKIMKGNSRTIFKTIWFEANKITAYDIIALINKEKKKGNIVDAVFVDYPDKMKPVTSDISKGDQSWDLVGKVMDNLKAVAKKMHVAVLAVSQFTRQGNKDSGNKSNIIKGGNTAGSQQKENNSDTLINMNFISKDDIELSSRNDIFKNYMKKINMSRMELANQLFAEINDNVTNSAQRFMQMQNLTAQADRATDILQLSFSMPDVQPVTNFIVKNRDGVGDITFDTYIGYGMYLISDYEEEAIKSAQFAVDTFSMITNYMYKNGMIDSNSIQICNNMINEFKQKLDDKNKANNISYQQNNTIGTQMSYRDFMKPQYGYNRPPIPNA